MILNDGYEKNKRLSNALPAVINETGKHDNFNGQGKLEYRDPDFEDSRSPLPQLSSPRFLPPTEKHIEKARALYDKTLLSVHSISTIRCRYGVWENGSLSLSTTYQDRYPNGDVLIFEGNRLIKELRFIQVSDYYTDHNHHGLEIYYTGRVLYFALYGLDNGYFTVLKHGKGSARYQINRDRFEAIWYLDNIEPKTQRKLENNAP